MIFLNFVSMIPEDLEIKAHIQDKVQNILSKKILEI